MLQRRTKALGHQVWKSDCFAASNSSFGSILALWPWGTHFTGWASISSPAKPSSWKFIKNSSYIFLYCTYLNLCSLLNSWKYLAAFWKYLHNIYVLYIKTPILWPPDVKSWLIGTDADAGKDWRREEKGRTADEMVGWHRWLNGHEIEQIPEDGEWQGSLAFFSPWGCKELDMT